MSDILAVLAIFMIPVALTICGMIVSGDLRITRKRQREWEERWDAIQPDERERIARNYWA